jgi:hypothetical protein
VETRAGAGRRLSLRQPGCGPPQHVVPAQTAAQSGELFGSRTRSVRVRLGPRPVVCGHPDPDAGAVLPNAQQGGLRLRAEAGRVRLPHPHRRHIRGQSHRFWNMNHTCLSSTRSRRAASSTAMVHRPLSRGRPRPLVGRPARPARGHGRQATTKYLKTRRPARLAQDQEHALQEVPAREAAIKGQHQKHARTHRLGAVPVA